MKNIKKLLIAFMGIILIPSFVQAASANISVKASGTAIVGNTITATVTISSGTPMGAWQFNVNYDSSKLKLTSGATAIADYTTSTSGTKSKSYTLKFQALKSGSASISIGSYLVYAMDDSAMSVSASSTRINIMTQKELEATYSKDNNLKELSVEGYTLTPEFSKDVLEYSVTIPSDVTKINIVAKQNDNTATVTGAGEHDVMEGNNKFEILVKAQNGSEKTYTVNVEVEDLNPIYVEIEDTQYTLVKRKDALTIPASNLYEESTVTIEEVEIPCFKNNVTNFILVGVKDENGKISLALYDAENNTYKLYQEFLSNNLVLYITDFPKRMEDYIHDVLTINEMEVEVYKYSKNSRFVICYAMDISTGEYNYYSYDTKENTFQIYNDEEVKELKENVKTYLYISLGFGVGLFIAFIIIIILLSKRNKRKQKMKREAHKEKEEELDDFLSDVKKSKRKK